MFGPGYLLVCYIQWYVNLIAYRFNLIIGYGKLKQNLKFSINMVTHPRLIIRQ